MILAVACALFTTSGCLSPIALDRAVLEYDRTVTRVEAEMLLLNIARSRHFHPIHFTAVSSVAATFDFRVNVGLTSSVFEQPGVVSPSASLGATVAENPTVTIVPVQGEEFTKRILTPMDETKFEFLINQGIEPSIILRLMASEILIRGYGESGNAVNAPHLKPQYEDFRRRVLHLSSLGLMKKLYVEQLIFEEEWPNSDPGKLSAREIRTATEQGYRWMSAGSQGRRFLSRRVLGRIAITNYDPRRLSYADRLRLHLEAQEYPRNYVLIDIRPGDPGGDYPLHGHVILRSFNSVLAFLALSMEAEPEYHVDKDSRTGTTGRNPPWTVAIEETLEKPTNAVFSVPYMDRWYSIREAQKVAEVVNPWNQDAFRLLTQLYQMTVTDISRTPTPAITIAK